MSTIMHKAHSGQHNSRTPKGKYVNWTRTLFPAAALIASVVSSALAGPVNMSTDEVLADGCSTLPDNFGLSEFWNNKMGALEAGCNYPAITQTDIGGRRKAQAYAHGSAGVIHDVNAIKFLNGTGNNSDTLGVAPRTAVGYGLYCADPTPVLESSKPGDVAFSLRAWSGENCSLTSDRLPTISIFGFPNHQLGPIDGVPVVYKPTILISSGYNYGVTIDYFSPGDSSNIGRGNMSYALPQFAGIITALNAALISQNRAILDSATIKAVLDASSDKVYLEVNGTRGIYNESQLPSLPSYKYYGQLVNLSNAIDYALSISPELTLLTLIKEVDNQHGGNASISDFDLRVTGGAYDGSIARYSGEWLEISDNTLYALGEFPLPGYTLPAVQCEDDDTGASLLHPLILAVGQSATCILTSSDTAPNITIIKEVINEHDGIAYPVDFTLHLSGETLDGKVDRLSGETLTVRSNTPYRLSEDPYPGYTQTGIVCRDDNSNANVGHPVILNEGQSVTCTSSSIDKVEPTTFVIPLPRGGVTLFNL